MIIITILLYTILRYFIGMIVIALMFPLGCNRIFTMMETCYNVTCSVQCLR